MIFLIGKLVLIAALFGVAIMAFPGASAAFAIGAVVTLVWVMRAHFKLPKKQP